MHPNFPIKVIDETTKYFEPKNDKMERGPQRSMCINFDKPLVLD